MASIFSASLRRSPFYLSGIQKIENDERRQTGSTEGPSLLNVSAFSWLLVGRDSLRTTLVTSMIIMGNLYGNRQSLAQDIIEHVTIFAPSSENTSAKFNTLDVVAEKLPKVKLKPFHSTMVEGCTLTTD